jgi:lactoylglutathione lyase
MSPNPPVPAAATKSARPQALNAVSLSASLTVKDLQKSVAWYRDVVGFAVDEEHRREGELRAVSLKAGAVRIVIGRDDGAKGWDRVKGEGFSLQITTTQNVDEMAKRIKDLGGHLASEPTDMPWGARVFRLQDPDGFKLAISSERRSG